MLRALLTGPVPRSVWRQRIRTCQRCPIYDRVHKACRVISPRGARLGCGCYVPFKALSASPYEGDGGRGCWGRATMGESEGWPEHRFNSPAEFAWTLIDFLLGR